MWSWVAGTPGSWARSCRGTRGWATTIALSKAGTNCGATAHGADDGRDSAIEQQGVPVIGLSATRRVDDVIGANAALSRTSQSDASRPNLIGRVSRAWRRKI